MSADWRSLCQRTRYSGRNGRWHQSFRAGRCSSCRGRRWHHFHSTDWVSEPDFDEHPIEANLRAIAKEIKLAKEIGNGGIVGVNIMVATREYDRYVKAAIEGGADLIISGAGLPVNLPQLAAGSSVKLAPIVSSVKSTEVILKYWQRKYDRLPDLVVIEGPRAGGHLGFRMEDLEEIDDAAYDEEIKRIIACVQTYAKAKEKEIPVVVAGGV